jgi:nucleoside-diphosphate kinase
MSDRTLVLLKPDAVERGLIGQITSRFEAKNLTIAAMELRQLDSEILARHYEEHQGKGFYGELVEFMSRGPVVAMVIEGEGAIAQVRRLCGATKVDEALPGTIRGDYAMHTGLNIIHASDSPVSAASSIL